MLKWFTVTLLTLLTALPGLASENGKSGRTSITSAGCGSCHNSSASSAVSVSIKGQTSPLKITPGQKVNLSVVVAHSSAAVAGIDLAVVTDLTGTTSAGTLGIAAGSGLKVSGSDVVHSAPKSMSAGQARFDVTWTAPSTPGTYYLRSVALAANGNGADDNADVWNRLPEFQLVVEAATPTVALTLTSPKGGEVFTPASVKNITWTSTLVNSVNIEWSSTGPAGPWTNVASTVAASSGTYAWTIPQTLTTTGFVRVVDVADATRTATHTKAFSIATAPPPPGPQLITVINPTGGEKYHPFDNVKIVWTSTTNQVPVSTGRRFSKNTAVQEEEDEYSEDGDEGDDEDSDDEDSDDEDSDDEDSDDDDGDDSDDEDGDDEDSDDSDEDDDGDDDDSTNTGGGNDSTDTGGGNDSTDTGDDDSTSTSSMVSIEWSSTGSQGPWMMIVSNLPIGKREYEWTVPNVITDDAFIRIQQVDSAHIYGMNDLAFAIIQDDSTETDDDSLVQGMDITRPANGEVLQPKNLFDIKWITNRNRMVTVQWNRCGDGWEDIVTSIPSSLGHYLWVVPQHADGVSIIRVVDAVERSRIYQVSGIFFIKNPAVTDVKETDGVISVPSSLHGSHTVKLYSMMGELIIEHGVTIDQQFTLDLPSYLTAGRYFIVISNNQTNDVTRMSVTIQ